MRIGAVLAAVGVVFGLGGNALAQSGDDESAWAGQEAAAVPVAIIDLRPGDPAALAASRDGFRDALIADGRLAVGPDDPAVVAILSGVGPGADGGDPALQLARAEATLAHARAAGTGDGCAGSRAEVESVISMLAGLQAAVEVSAGEAGLADRVTRALADAYGQRLLCAHQAGDVDAGLLVASRMRALGIDEAALPAGVSPGLWQTYPALDATANAQLVEVAIATEPSGATVWLNHRKLGPAPVTALVPEGRHLAAAASADGEIARGFDVVYGALPKVAWDQSPVLPVTLALPAGSGSWRAEAALLARWRNGLAAVDGEGMRTILAKLGLRFVLVLTTSDTDQSGNRVEIWAHGAADDAVRRVGTGSLTRPQPIVTRIVARAQLPVQVADDTDPEPEYPLLREDDVVDRYGARPGQVDAGRPWWVYATIVGAVASSVALILASDLGDERQRIELRLP